MVEAAFDRRARPPSATAGVTPGLGSPPPPGFAPLPPYPPYGQQFAPTPTIDAAAVGAAVKSALGSASHRRTGELKPALASTGQKEARTVCSSEVFEAITDPVFVEAERALGSLSQRGGTSKAAAAPHARLQPATSLERLWSVFRVPVSSQERVFPFPH